jgi:hypothetical protein
MNTPHRSPRLVRIGSIIAALLMVLSACSSDNDTEIAADDVSLTADGGSLAAGSDTVTASTENDDEPEIGISTQIGTSTQIMFEEADVRGEEPFAPEAEITQCRAAELNTFLDSEPTVAAAWAEAADLQTDEITETIGSYTATVLTTDTRVTNHAYKGGVARGFQATLEAGTAVLVDDAGVPRVRCACGNPLAPPRPTGDEIPDGSATQVPVTTTTAPAPTQNGFCATWQIVGPDMIGGPSGASAEAMAEYFNGLVDGLDQLIAAAQVEPGFPPDALTDLIDYRGYIAVVALTPENPGDGDEFRPLRDRVEAFVLGYCGPLIDDGTPTVPTHVDEEDGQDDGDSHDGGDIDTGDQEDGLIGNCGSMQFILLAAVAENLGIDHVATSQPFVDALQALANGIDPGAEYDVADLSILLAQEEIGCQGAQAMQQLIIDNGYGHLLEGTSLGA